MPNGINFSGLGSGIDFGAITDSIITQRSRPINQLLNKQSDYKNRTDALRQLNTKLSVFQDAARALSDSTLSSGKAASTSTPSVILATASSSADVGSFNVQVTQLASQLTQASKAFTSTSSTVLAGAATSGTFELRKGAAASGTEITIDSSNNTLSGLRDAINGANAGVTATIVDVTGDGTGNKLVLTSKETGSAGRVELVETSSTGTGTDLNFQSLNLPNSQFSDLDAKIKISGLQITRSSNTITDAVPGITFTLKDVGSSNIAITNNEGLLKSKITAFAEAYKGVQDAIDSQYKLDDKGRPTGILAGDSTLQVVQQELRNIFNATASTNGGAFSSLEQIGFTRDTNGKVTIDQSILNSKLNSNLSDVQLLFSGNSALASKISSTVEGLTNTIKDTITGYDSSRDKISKNISAQQTRLDLLRESLTRQFSIAEAAISQLNGQGSTLSSTLSSLSQSQK